MSRLYRPMLDLAPRLTRLAKTITFTYATTDSYSPTTGLATYSETTATVQGVVEEFDESEFGDSVFAGDLKITVAAKGFTIPKPDDRLTIDGREHHVIAIEHIMVGTNPVAHQIQVQHELRA